MFTEEKILVNMAEYKIAIGHQKLVTENLGSCVGICMRDSGTGIGGLLHIMLPECPVNNQDKKLYPKFADTGIDMLVSDLLAKGADKNRLVAKIAGAAHMIRHDEVPEEVDLSSRNLAAVRAKLSSLRIPIQAMEVEGYIPRTIIFEPATGVMTIKTVGRGDRTL